MADLEYLMSLAEAIGSRIESGNLPPQDANGLYLLDDAAREVANLIR